MVYVDTLAGALYLERPQELVVYAAAFEQLRHAALDVDDTRSALRTIRDNLKN